MPILMSQLKNLANEEGNEKLRALLEHLNIKNPGMEIPIETEDLRDNKDLIVKHLNAFKERGKLDKTSFLNIMRAGAGDAKALRFLDKIHAKKPSPFDGVSANAFLLMNEKELAAFSEIIDGDMHGKKLNQDEVHLIQKYAATLDSAEQIKALGDCIRTMMKNDIPLTRILGGKLNAFLKSVNKEQIESVAAILTTLSDNKALNSKSFDYVVKNASNLEGKGKDLAQIFKNMKKLGFPIVGNRQKLIDLAAKSTDENNHLAEFKTVLASFKEINRTLGTKFDRSHFETLLANQGRLTGKSEALRSCIEAMAKNDVQLITTTKNRLNTLLNFKPEQLEAVGKVLSSLAGSEDEEAKSFLNERTTDYIIKNSQVIAAKADEIVGAFKAMREAGIELEGLRQPIMTKPAAELRTLATLFQQMKNPGGPVKLDTPLDNKAIKAILSNANKIGQKDRAAVEASEDFSGKAPAEQQEAINEALAAHAKELGTCINLMNKAGLPLTSTLGQDNLSSLLDLKASELSGINTIMASLPKEALNQRTFDYLVKNAAELGQKFDGPKVIEGVAFHSKADLIAGVFKHMQNMEGIPIAGNRQPVMNMSADNLANLNIVLGKMAESDHSNNLDPDSFKSLINNIGQVKTANHAEALGRCIKNMKDNGIRLTQTLGQDKLKRLLSLEEANIAAVDKIFKALADGKALDEPTFNYIMDHANQEEFIAKAEDISKVLNALSDAGIELKGHRQNIMELSSENLQTLATLFEQLKKPEGLEPAGVKAIIDNVGNLGAKDLRGVVRPEERTRITQEYATELGQAIKAMHSQGIKPTQILGKDRLTRLMEMDTAGLKAVNKLFNSLKKDDTNNYLNERTADFILDQMENNKADFTKSIDDMVKVFESMHAANVDLKGLRQTVMTMPATANNENLNHFALQQVFAGINQGEPKRDPGLDTDSAKALIARIPQLTEKTLEDALNAKKERIRRERLDDDDEEEEEIEADEEVILTLEEKKEALSARAQSLGKSIDFLHNNQIPLTQTIGANKIDRLAALGSKELDDVSNILDQLNLQKDKGALDESIVNYLIDNASELSKAVSVDGPTKGQLIADAFAAMHNAGIDLKGNRRPLMKMDPEEIKQLTTLLNKLNNDLDKKITLPKDAFKSLRDNMANFKEEQTDILINCVRTLLDSSIGLTQMFGKDKITQLIDLQADPDKLAAVEEVLTTLNRTDDLDAKTFDNILEHAGYLKEEHGGKTKAKWLAEAFNALSTRGIPIKGNRQPLMDLSSAQLQTFTENLGRLSVTEKINITHQMDIAKGGDRTVYENFRHDVTSAFKGGN